MLAIVLSIAWSRTHGGWLSFLLLLGCWGTDFLFRTTFILFHFLFLKSLLGLLLLKGFLLHFLLLLHLDLSFPFFVSLLLFNESIAYLFGQVEVYSIVFDKSGERLPTIIYLTELYE